MYKAITSFWSKPKLSKRTQVSQDLPIDEDSWVIVSDAAIVPSSTRQSSSCESTNDSAMTNSWIEPVGLSKQVESPQMVHHFNPFENLLIEHASMSVYEQIAPKARNRRTKSSVPDQALDERTEETKEDDTDNDNQTTINQHCSNITSIHHRVMNLSSMSALTTLESSTLSLTAHHHHLQRLHHQQRRPSSKSTSKLTLPNIIDKQKQAFNDNIELECLNHLQTSKNGF